MFWGQLIPHFHIACQKSTKIGHVMDEACNFASIK